MTSVLVAESQGSKGRGGSALGGAQKLRSSRKHTEFSGKCVRRKRLRSGLGGGRKEIKGSDVCRDRRNHPIGDAARTSPMEVPFCLSLPNFLLILPSLSTILLSYSFSGTIWWSIGQQHDTYCSQRRSASLLVLCIRISAYLSPICISSSSLGLLNVASCSRLLLSLSYLLDMLIKTQFYY